MVLDPTPQGTPPPSSSASWTTCSCRSFGLRALAGASPLDPGATGGLRSQGAPNQCPLCPASQLQAWEGRAHMSLWLRLEVQGCFLSPQLWWLSTDRWGHSTGNRISGITERLPPPPTARQAEALMVSPGPMVGMFLGGCLRAPVAGCAGQYCFLAEWAGLWHGLMGNGQSLPGRAAP